METTDETDSIQPQPRYTDRKRDTETQKKLDLLQQKCEALQIVQREADTIMKQWLKDEQPTQQQQQQQQQLKQTAGANKSIKKQERLIKNRKSASKSQVRRTVVKGLLYEAVFKMEGEINRQIVDINERRERETVLKQGLAQAQADRARDEQQYKQRIASLEGQVRTLQQELQQMQQHQRQLQQQPQAYYQYQQQQQQQQQQHHHHQHHQHQHQYAQQQQQQQQQQEARGDKGTTHMRTKTSPDCVKMHPEEFEKAVARSIPFAPNMIPMSTAELSYDEHLKLLSTDQCDTISSLDALGDLDEYVSPFLSQSNVSAAGKDSHSTSSSGKVGREDL